MVALSISFILYQTNQKNSYSAIFNSNMEEVQLVEKVQPIEEVAQIQNINYSTQWQQTPVVLDVITSNTNYDKITINDMENLKISDNGTYTVKLLLNNEVIDQQVITITNIDRISPDATSKKDDNNYYFYLTDDISGIDASTIQYIKNGVASSDYTYTENTLVVPYDSTSTHKIYIYDYAGNMFTITIE
jgi:hypothetical protein